MTDDLPVPVDDGACDHLEGMLLPSLLLETSSGNSQNLSELKASLLSFITR